MCGCSLLLLVTVVALVVCERLSVNRCAVAMIVREPRLLRRRRR